MVNESAKIQQFSGSWKQVEHHGLNEFLEAQGIGWIKRKVAVKCNPVDNIQVDDESITIAYTAVGVISGSNTYKIDDTTNIKNFQEEEVKADCKVDGDKLVLTMTGGKAGTIQITRLIKDDKLHVEQTIVEKNISATRIFQRVGNPVQIIDKPECARGDATEQATA